MIPVDTSVAIDHLRGRRESGADLFTRNVRHFPMFEGLTAPY